MKRRGIFRQGRVAIGTLVLVLASGGLILESAGRSEVRAVGHPLDPYPGFGRSEGPALRDDAIALWESYRREAIVSDCMAYDDFLYWPEIAFPPGAVIEVAEYVGVPPVEAPGKSGEERNREYRESLEPDALNRYTLALWGESAADITASDEEGVVPPGRSPESFARGGCMGHASESIPGIWTAKRILEDEVERMGQETLESQEVQQARVEFSACMVQHSGVALEDPRRAEESLETLTAVDPAAADRVVSALAVCHEIWVRGYRGGNAAVAELFIERNKGVLNRQLEFYANVRDQMRSDDKFMNFLSNAAAISALQVADSPGHVG